MWQVWRCGVPGWGRLQVEEQGAEGGKEWVYLDGRSEPMPSSPSAFSLRAARVPPYCQVSNFWLGGETSEMKARCLVAIATLSQFAPPSIANASSPCTADDYVGNPFNMGVSGHVSATATFEVPAGYSGTSLGGAVQNNGVAIITMNANSYLGGPLTWPQSVTSQSGMITCLGGGPATVSFSQGQVTNWNLLLVGGPPPISQGCAGGIEAVETTNYTPSSTITPSIVDVFGIANNPYQPTSYGQINSDAGSWTLASTSPPPAAAAEALQAPNNLPIQIDLTSGSACGATSATLVTKPLKGTVTGFPSTTVLYTPSQGAAGSDIFQFALANGGGMSNVVEATVMFAPLAVDENVSTQKNTEITIDLTVGAEGNPTSAALVGTPVGGTVRGFPSTTVTFKPDKGPPGLAGGFDFKLVNSLGTSNTAVVTVWTTLFSAQTKKAFAQQGSVLGYVNDDFEFAALATDPKNLVGNVAMWVATKVLANLIAGNDQITGEKIDFMTSSALFTVGAFKHFKGSTPASAFLEAEALVSGLGSLGANIIASDPPDPNYKIIAKPRKLPFPKTGNTTLDSINEDYLEFSSLSAATVHASERWQGAMLEGDLKSAALQSRALTKYSAELATAQSKMISDNAALSGAFQPVNLNTFPGGAAAIAAAFNKECGKPLPKSLNDVLLAYASQDVINATACAYANSISPLDISTDFESILQ